MADGHDRCEWVSVILVPAHPDIPEQKPVKRLLLLFVVVVHSRMATAGQHRTIYLTCSLTASNITS